jgi:4-hydroxy-2-oxoheptanedioate aldolase
MDVYSRAARFGYNSKANYLNGANQGLIIAVQIEGLEGVTNLEEILKVEGIDIIYIGPYDLSQSMGIPGQVNDPRVIEEIKKICQRVHAAKRFIGIYVDDIETAHRYRDLGIQFITIMVDVVIFARACNQLVENLKKR